MYDGRYTRFKRRIQLLEIQVPKALEPSDPWTLFSS